MSIKIGILGYGNLGRSVALPPQIIITSILSFQSSTSATLQTVAVSVRILTSSGFLLVNTATRDVYKRQAQQM